MDPMGIHTGDSDYSSASNDVSVFRIRDYALMMKSGNFAGGCNVQFAVSLTKKVICESTIRVSRSSALASKATVLLLKCF
jgi:carbamoyl-phosphate synthase large subunit